ncbi:hypothetical protein CEV34_3133 [Brucella pseudogrignonensis]|uniref:Uncharacterized protein n=1 Tax=Brucella pseudogrignonensis TaxID=419475 RepID=A0A256GAP0_9HYPH|nr:hypothetical protein CEV34_3133 [Brucella pseudogrignonensis]
MTIEDVMGSREGIFQNFRRVSAFMATTFVKNGVCADQ